MLAIVNSNDTAMWVSQAAPVDIAVPLVRQGFAGSPAPLSLANCGQLALWWPPFATARSASTTPRSFVLACVRARLNCVVVVLFLFFVSQQCADAVPGAVLFVLGGRRQL